MDSVTQFVLGAAIGVAAVGRRAPIWRSALWGGVCGTLPDLDVLIDRGDAIRDMTMHRAESHSLFYLTLVAPAIGWLIARIHGDGQFRRWSLMAWLALVTHPLLDLLTVYGTQLGQPFTDRPYFVGSVFVIDPAVTLPLLAGLVIALVRGPPGLAWNRLGLVIAGGYLAWSLAVQAQVRDVARASLDSAGVVADRVLVVPTPFNTVLWRIVAMTPGEDWYEGFHSLLDAPGPVRLTRHRTDQAARRQNADNWHLERLAWFSHGFFDVATTADGLRIRDLRMGQGDAYTFTFLLPLRKAGASSIADETAARTGETGAVIQQASRVDLPVAMHWLWRRMLGEPLPLPATLRRDASPEAGRVNAAERAAPVTDRAGRTDR